MQEIEKTPVIINITQDAEGRMEQTSEEVISSIKSELYKIGLPYSDVVANDKGSTYFVVTKDGKQHEILRLIKTGNALVKPILAKAKWINHLIKTQPQDLYDFVNAELTALEKVTSSEFSTEKETSLAMMNELELFNYLKEKEEPEINKYESYNDLLNNQTREIQNNIKRAKGIKNYLLKLAERDSSDSLNDLTIEKILKNNPNIKKSC